MHAFLWSIDHVNLLGTKSPASGMIPIRLEEKQRSFFPLSIVNSWWPNLDLKGWGWRRVNVGLESSTEDRLQCKFNSCSSGIISCEFLYRTMGIWCRVDGVGKKQVTDRGYVVQAL